jgi:hypothetical protein
VPLFSRGDNVSRLAMYAFTSYLSKLHGSFQVSKLLTWSPFKENTFSNSTMQK